MFATISYNTGSPDDEIWVEPASAQYFGGRRPARLACTECRAKKVQFTVTNHKRAKTDDPMQVKCTGEKTGCAKCRTNGIQCVYPASSERGAQAKRRRTSSVPSQHNASNNVTSNPTRSASAGKDGSASPPTIDTDINDSLLPSSVQLPSTDHDSLPACLSPSLFDLTSKDLNSQDLSLDSINMDDDFSYGTYAKYPCSLQVANNTNLDLERLRSPLMNPFGDLKLLTPASTASLTPFQGSGTPQLHGTNTPQFHGTNTSQLHGTATPGSYTATSNIECDIQNAFGDPQPCSCLQSAVHMLEKLELKIYDDSELSTDIVLKNQKVALTQFHSWLACEQCPTPRATSMLFALIIEQLSLYLEKGVSHYFRQLQQGNKEDKKIYGRPGVVGEYQIESRHEWGQVMMVLLLIRSRELGSAIARLKKRAMLDPMLAGPERRIRRIMSKLQGDRQDE